jgi:hypothetical protein
MLRAWFATYRLVCADSGANTIEVSGGEHSHLFESIEVGQAGHREVLKYSPLAALRQSNTCHNHIEDRRAFLLWQSGLLMES